jgi:hypothetical protein
MDAQYSKVAPDLSVLSLKAAAELDAIRAGAQQGTECVRQFVNHIKDQNGLGTPEKVKNLAPSAVKVIRRAVHAYSGKDIHSPEDLSREFTALFSELDRSLKPGTEILEKLISFCVAFHNEFIEQQRKMIGSRRVRSPLRV